MISREELDREVAAAVGGITPLIVEEGAHVWVGSGISRDILGGDGKPYYPTWNSLIEGLCVRCGVSLGSIATGEELTDRADDCKTACPDGYGTFLGEVFGGQPPTPSRAALVAMGFAGDITITTNYDQSLEEAADHHGLGITVQTYPHLRPGSGVKKPCLVYLHGRAPDARGHPATDLVLSTSEFEEAYAHESVEQMGNAFSYLFGELQGQSVLFIGYSLREPEIVITLKQLRTVETRFAVPKGRWVILAPRSPKPHGDDLLADRGANDRRDEEEQIRRLGNYGVEVVGYTKIGNDHGQLKRILKALRDVARAARRGETPPSFSESEGVVPHES